MRAIAIFMLLGGPALGCSCSSLTVCELVQQPVLFIGEVIDGGVSSIREDPWYSKAEHVRFRVVENFRGLPKDAKVVDIDIFPTFGMCSPNPYFLGRTYLVSPRRIDGKLMDGACFSGRDVERSADTVSYVREFFAGKQPLNVRGRVASAGDSSLVEFLLLMGETKALAGVTVSASREGKKHSAITDSDGRYQLPVPQRGIYRVDATLSPYGTASATVDVGAGGCAVRDFGLPSESTISGKVWDGKGQPVRHAKVGLIDLDRKNNPDQPFYLLHAYTEQPDQSFLFKGVPVGRYLLVFNPDGPRSGGLPGDLPLESTYYPVASSRREARVIEIGGADTHLTTHDLVIGRPVSFRSVVVKVRFPDGAPMQTAQVAVEAEPIEKDGVSWTLRRVAGKDGMLKFQAPVNRKLRIEIRDWHGRDLKTEYVSTHAAGASAIEQEVVIVP